MTLVRGLTGIIHRSDCSVVGQLHKVLATDIPDDEVAAFLLARGYADLCRMCLREFHEPLVATRKKSIS